MSFKNRQVVSALAFMCLLAGIGIVQAHAQQARWTQLMQQAQQLVAQGRSGAALPLAQQAVQAAQATWGAQDSHTALSLDTLGGIDADLNDYSGAESAFQQALAIDSKTLGASNIQTARVMADLGELYGSHGQYGAADQLFHAAIPVYGKEYGQAGERVADLVFKASDVLLSEAHSASSFADAKSKYDSATNGFLLAARVYLKAKGDSNAGLAHCYDRLAAIAEDGSGHAVAEKLHKHALEILEQVYGPDSMELVDSLEGLARVYKDQQQLAAAEPVYQRVLKIEQAHLSPDSPGLKDGEADLAALYYVWGKPAQADPYFQAYLGNLMNQFRANASTMSERERLIYFSAFRNDFPLFYSFVLKYHAQMPQLTGQMYDAVLNQKGLIAESAASMRAAVAASGDPQAVAMLDKLTSDKAQLAALVESMGANPTDHSGQIQQLGQEANTLEQTLMKRSAAMSQQKAQNAATWRDVQRALKPGDAAVEVVRFQYETGAAVTGQQIYAALIVTPLSKEPALVVLGAAKELEAAPMLAYRNNVARTRGFEEEAQPAAPGEQAGAVVNAGAAYAAFWKPLEPALIGARRVYVSPAGVLNTIPIGLMADSSGKMLMEKVQLETVNSTKDLLLPAHVAQARSALLVGNPKVRSDCGTAKVGDLRAARRRDWRGQRRAANCIGAKFRAASAGCIARRRFEGIESESAAGNASGSGHSQQTAQDGGMEGHRIHRRARAEGCGDTGAPTARGAYRHARVFLVG